MQQILLGTSSIRVSRLGYGCWRTARSTDDTENLAITRSAVFAAFDAGYTLFDHADIYCGGEAESTFGRLLAENSGLRSRIVLATKCGICLPQLTGGPYRYDSSKDYILAQVEGSLRRLRVDSIDLMQLHRPDFLMEPEEVASAFDSLRTSGKVREFGVSNFSVSQTNLLQSMMRQRLIVNQIELSLLQMAPLHDGTLDQCQQERMTPLAWSPLAGGLLGNGAQELLPAQQGYDPARAVQALDTLAAEKGSTRTALALGWLLRHPSGVIPLVGSTVPTRIHEAAAANAVTLSRVEWYSLLTAARSTPLP